jgi:hypothetical protein
MNKLTSPGTTLGFVCLSVFSTLAFAGPEPDATYKFVISFSALLTIVILLGIATGFLARALGLPFWRWFIAQLLAAITSIVLFFRLLSLWQTAVDMTVLNLLLTDIVFETWSTTNLLLLASVFFFTLPLVILAIFGLFKRFTPPQNADD